MGFRRNICDVIFGKSLARVGRRLHHLLLGGPGLFAGNIRRRNRPLFNWEERLSGFAVEDEELAELGRLDGSVNMLAANIQRNQSCRAGKVAVPQIVMHHLVVPNSLTGGGVQRNQAVGKEV